jgi:hypothetical protein
MAEPTYEELLAQVAALQQAMASRAPHVAPHAPSPIQGSSDHTTVHVTPEQVTLTSKPVPVHEPQAALVRGRQILAKRAARTATPEEIADAIRGLKVVITSGVESAGYGDKRTEFRSLAELRQILSDLEEELDETLGRGGRIRQIRMTNQWDKGL